MYLGTIAKLGTLAKRASCNEVRGMVQRLMTHLFLVKGAVCAETDMVEDVVVVVGAVDAMGAVVEVVAPLVTLYVGIIGIVGVSTGKYVST